jgi:hypothetical protein
MSFDISRSTFRPRKNFLGVVMQQGRVQLDSDWNEWQSEFSRRVQAETLDTVGRAVYSSSTPNAFLITPGTTSSGANTLAIGAGRYYVDGLLAENHGPETDAVWDTALAELSGAPCGVNSTVVTDYFQQPYLPSPAPITGNGPFLAYLDVWQRDVTYLEDPHLVDKAVGIDTTGRLQTVWQVKLMDLSNVAGGATCSTDIPAWDALLQAPAAQLTTGLVPNAGSGPCCLAPNTGYTGQENQLYRVEIHQPGTAAAAPSGGFAYPLAKGTPTFKWSRDNASVATSVSGISTLTTSSGSVSQLTVASLGRDEVLGFAAGQWIEIVDDVYELNGQPGELFQITAPPVNFTLTLNGTVSSHFPLTSGQTDPTLHTRIRRWDQAGNVNQTDASGNTTLWINLNGPGSTGDIPIPPAGTTLVLENGVTVAFDLSPATFDSVPTTFNTGDYWNFDARTADGSVETLTAAPPAGIHHHYARLSVFTFPNPGSDCRTEWPPTASGNCCGCTVNLTPGDLTANNTLQNVLDKYQNMGTPTTICLGTGTYSLASPLRLTPAHTNITLEACQAGGVRIQALSGNETQFGDGLLVLDNVDEFSVTGIDFVVPVAAFQGKVFAGLPLSSLAPAVATMLRGLLVSIGIRIVNGTNITVANCAFALGSSERGFQQQSNVLMAAGIFATGQNDGIKVEGNEFTAATTKVLRLKESFLTGFLLSSAVAFPAPIQIQAVDAQKTVATGGSAVPAEVAQKEVAAKTTAAQVNPAVVPAVSETPDAVLSTLLTEKLPEGGLQFVGGQLQNIGGFLLPTAATLASQGGTVLAATLDDSVLRDNAFNRMTVAALLLGEEGTVDVLANQVEACQGGFWFLTPAQTQELLLDPQGLSMFGATVALGYPLPQADSSTNTATVAAAPASVRIYTGTKNYTDSSKNVWLPDTSTGAVTVSGGTVTHPSPLPAVTGTQDPTLYQSERWAPSFSYTFNKLPMGYYTLTLKFAEIFYTNPQTNQGARFFDVSINGEQVLTNFNIVVDVGGALIADDLPFHGIAPNGAGQIVVQFTGTSMGTDVNAKIDAAELDPQWTGAPFLGAGNESDAASFFDQLAQLAYQGYADLGYSQAQLRIEDNEMHELTNPGLLLAGDDSLVNGNSGSLMMRGNRIDGTLTYSDFAYGDVAGNAFLAAPSAGLRMFAFLAAIARVSRCVVTSNMLTTPNRTNDYGFSLYLNDAAVQKGEIAVMSNLFTGRTEIAPTRGLGSSGLSPILQTWNFLNTVITS